ncbi:MAG: chitobiase/beta-hexosaminidase C-terminal domain-containing protein, partial [Planctomycetes bacterium]|nr:chitobiase/beta-hexosaminidase C-terminal domain-containing protein [Planctomycetota bacterium]
MRKHLRLAAGGSAAGRWMLSILLALPALPAPGQVVLNELLASNRFTSFDEDGDSSDWVEIHNPSGLVTAHLERYGLSDRGSEPHKWVFPDVTIPPGGYLKVWLSGKDRYAPAPSAVAGDPMAYPFEASIIPPEAEWKYLVADPAQAGPPAGWNLPGFDASSFLTGNAGFGYGDEDDFTELAPGTNAVFIRRVFHIEPHRALDNLILQVDYDDGFVAYLNGQRVASANAPAGDPTSSSWAAGSHEAGTPARFDLTPRLGLLRPGDNVLALVGLNISAGSSDMSLHPALGVIPRILHASFSLNADGESLMLTNALGDLVDAVVYPVQTEDHSYGRAAAEGGRWCYLLTPTPEAPNETAHFDEPISSSIEFDPPAGMYAGAITVSMSATPPGLMSIHYTLDGSEPTTASPRFWLSLPIDGNKVVRAAGFIGEERATRTVSQSYFIDNTSALPILSISMDPVEYALVHNTADGRGRAWERPAFLEYFDEDGRRAAATGMGLRLHGGAGRGGDFETKKAYRVYFRSVYGDARLHCPIIPETPVDRFDKLVLRSAFNDCFRTNGRATYLRDELIRDLHEDMGAL